MESITASREPSVASQSRTTPWIVGKPWRSGLPGKFPFNFTATYARSRITSAPLTWKQPLHWNVHRHRNGGIAVRIAAKGCLRGGQIRCRVHQRSDFASAKDQYRRRGD